MVLCAMRRIRAANVTRDLRTWMETNISGKEHRTTFTYCMHSLATATALQNTNDDLYTWLKSTGWWTALYLSTAMATVIKMLPASDN